MCRKTSKKFNDFYYGHIKIISNHGHGKRQLPNIINKGKISDDIKQFMNSHIDDNDQKCHVRKKKINQKQGANRRKKTGRVTLESPSL